MHPICTHFRWGMICMTQCYMYYLFLLDCICSQSDISLLLTFPFFLLLLCFFAPPSSFLIPPPSAVLCVFPFNITSVYLEKLPENVQRKCSFIVSLSASPRWLNDINTYGVYAKRSIQHSLIFRHVFRIGNYTGLCVHVRTRAHTHNNGGRG